MIFRMGILVVTGEEFYWRGIPDKPSLKWVWPSLKSTWIAGWGWGGVCAAHPARISGLRQEDRDKIWLHVDEMR
jgi:hypothetical protein